jgi:hypothetical protein
VKTDFDNIFDHVVSMENFQLSWRFTDEKYDRLPDQHLDQLKPLDKAASDFLWSFISNTDLHRDIPFKTDYFQTIDKANILDNKSEIKKWLYQRGLPFEKNVFLSWDKENSMIVPWKLLIKYFDSFHYPASDDLTVIDQSLNWALLFYNEDEIYFGTKSDFKRSETFSDIDFIW